MAHCVFPAPGFHGSASALPGSSKLHHLQNFWWYVIGPVLVTSYYMLHTEMAVSPPSNQVQIAGRSCG
jgi:hypothetical protein